MYNPNDTVTLPARFVPQYLVKEAFDKGKEKNLLLKTYGGIGDQICAEPTIRYAVETFTDCKISLATYHPELFTHLKFDWVYNLNKEKNRDFHEYFVLDTFLDPSHLFWEYCMHMAMNAVDFSSICALRCQLPSTRRHLILKPPVPKNVIEFPEKHIFVHAGRSWPSKTYPIKWWEGVTGTLIKAGITPVLIGADSRDDKGFVNIDSAGCIDLRNKTSLLDCIWYLQRAKVVLTSDSAILHAATSGDAWIGFLATAGWADVITHWRSGGYSWRMKDFAKGNMVDHFGILPRKETLRVDEIDPDILMSWLPHPQEFALWAVEKLDAH